MILTTRFVGVVMRQCPSCRKIYPNTLGHGGYCSPRCQTGEVRALRAALRLRRLARWLELPSSGSVASLKDQSRPVYDQEFTRAIDEAHEEKSEDLEDESLADDMYDQAVQLVAESQQASISWLQRRLRVGYNRAARMIERMEKEGLVSPADGVRPREVRMRRSEAL